MYLWAWGTIIMWACCPSPNRGACETSAPPSNGCNLASLAFHHSMWDCHSQLWTGPIPPHRHVPPVILWWQIQHLRTRMDHGWPWFHHYQPDRAGMSLEQRHLVRWLIPRTTPPLPSFAYPHASIPVEWIVGLKKVNKVTLHSTWVCHPFKHPLPSHTCTHVPYLCLFFLFLVPFPFITLPRHLHSLTHF